MTHAGQKFYQLTHDYLVPSLREWLTRKQRETRQGRAELRLADRSALWNSMPENRHLPSLWEYLSIQLLTNRKNWPESQRKMMRKAGRIHRIRFGAILTLFIILWMSGRMIYWRTEEERRATSAAFLVDQLISADIAQVPGIVSKLDGYRRWADPLLRKAYAREAQDSPEKLRLALALLPVDESKSAYLRDQLLVVTPDQFPTVRDALLGAVTIPTASEVRRMSASQLQKSQRLIQDLVPINIQSRILSLWEMALDPKLPTEQRFQAACALAAYTPYGDVRWTQINTLMARHLVSRQASDFVTWRSFLRPAKTQLFEPLASICRDKDQPRQARLYATETLADYASDDPNILFNLLADAEAFQFPVLFGKLIIHRQEAVALARQELAKPLGDNANEDEREALAQRQANAAVSLYRMGEYELVWPLLKYSPDPRVRSYIIHWLGLLGGDPQANIERLDREPDVTIRRALVLMLGEFNDTQLPVTERQPLIERLLAVYENEPDAGLHGVAEWLLRKWGQDNRLNAVVEQVKNTEEQLQDRKPDDKKQWYINSQEQTFVIVDPGEFLMGSPASEKGHNGSEVQHRQRISRRYAISAHEVTRLQFRAFAKGKDVINENSEISRTDDSPQVVLTWYDATRYCNWLSEQEGIPSEERFYVPNENQRYGPGMKINERGLDVRGYRLPTEAEWECACRAGTVTIRYYGAMELLLPIYAWYGANGQDRAWPVGSLKPNDLGLFDTLGNVDEWCNERYGPIYPFPDKEDLIKDGVSRVLRGGAFDRPPRDVRSSSRGFNQPGTRDVDIGFRPARTYP
jgi:formylglycine-generating enzyme required for sulfatase activity